MIYIYSLSTKEEPGNIRYVGKTKETLNRRLKRHLSPHYLNGNYYKVNWLKSELKKGHTPIIEIIDIVREDEWEFWECYWIAQFKVWGFSLTNGTIGGDGIKLTKEIIEKRNESNKKSKKRKESYARLRKEYIPPQEIIDNYNVLELDGFFSGIKKCLKCKKDIVYKSKRIYNVIRSIKRAISENRVCNNCKASGDKNHFFGKKLNDGKLKQERYGKKIIQTDLIGKKIAEFKSIREASEKTGIDRKSISNCAKGIKSYNTAGGYKFKIK